MKVTHAGRRITVEVTSDGAGVVSHAGSALLAQVADKTGLTRALSRQLEPLQLRAGSHDRGHVVRDLAVMLADGGDCLGDLGAIRDQAALFGQSASDSTAFRVIDQIATDPEAIGWLRGAHATARARMWELAGAPQRLTIDLDATLLTSHSDKEGAEPTYKRGLEQRVLPAQRGETGEVAVGAAQREAVLDGQRGEVAVGDLARGGGLFEQGLQHLGVALGGLRDPDGWLGEPGADPSPGVEHRHPGLHRPGVAREADEAQQ